jgi:hypothetical protein
MRPTRVLCVHPGASWSTADVESGLRYGLQHHGVEVIPFRLDQRFEYARNFLFAMWRKKRKTQPDLQKPNNVDIAYQASVGALEMAMRHHVDAVVIVSAMLFHPDVIVMMKRAGLFVTIVFTESPYDHEQELRFAKMVDGCWTNERSVVNDFRAVNPNAGYLPHGWHPEKHYVSARSIADVPSHDVVFVGSGFSERVTWFNAIDWTGIDLGLYGTWKGLGLKKQVMACVKGEQIENEYAGALYRRAKIGLNLYRSSKGWAGRGRVDRITRADSLSPRAYELAACGSFHLSEYRAEVSEVFGDLVPTFQTPTEAAALIRLWLADPAGRARVAAALPASVAEASWIHRSQIVLGDLQALLNRKAA